MEREEEKARGRLRLTTSAALKPLARMEIKEQTKTSTLPRKSTLGPSHRCSSPQRGHRQPGGCALEKRGSIPD